MVTTIGIQTQEIVALFDQAAARVKEMIEATDVLDREVCEIALSALDSAVQVVLPALKLVDQSLKFKGPGGFSPFKTWEVRGIKLSNSTSPRVSGHTLVLTRDGKFWWGWWDSNSDPEFYTEVRYPKEVDQLIMNAAHHDTAAFCETILNLLQQLQAVFAEAMRNNEARHQILDELHHKLGSAVAVLNPEPA